VVFEILAIMVPVVLIAGLGVAWTQRGKDFDTTLITNLVYYFGAPALVFSTLSVIEFDAALGNFALAAIASFVGFAVLGAPILLALKMPVRTYLSTLMFPNMGNMGLPICLFAFGDAGLVLAVIYFSVAAVAHYTIGVWLLSGERTPTRLFKTPLVYAAGAALIFQGLGATPPGWLANTASLLGGMTIPLLLLTLGVSLATTKVGHLVRGSRIAVLRLSIGFAVGWAISTAFGFTGVERGVVILDCTMPVAVFSYLLASRFDRAPEDVAGAIAVSTGLSVITLPLILALVL
jgi:predicted permease